MNTRFDSFISSVINQLNEDNTVVTNAASGPAGSNLTPDIVNSFRDVLTPLANNQQPKPERLAAAVQAGVIQQETDGSHTVSDAAIAHISPADTELGGKFLPAAQARTSGKAAAAAPQKAVSAQKPSVQSSNTNQAGVVGATSYRLGS